MYYLFGDVFGGYVYYYCVLIDVCAYDFRMYLRFFLWIFLPEEHHIHRLFVLSACNLFGNIQSFLYHVDYYLSNNHIIFHKKNRIFLRIVHFIKDQTINKNKKKIKWKHFYFCIPFCSDL